MDKKRVECLYRVSTKGQVDKDDIPMQKLVCREFAEYQGWEIVHEYFEKGVSGYKVSADDRDKILNLKRDAMQGKFDILLVFMFDRLGRREDETPFVVEWFARNGIEVWSAKEGQQRFETHVDKLTNFIRYWQAAGESAKTSIRVATRMSQMVKEGLFRGGTPPYGYMLVKKGRTNKKEQEVYDIQINPEEAPVVNLIFDMYINEGYGTQRLSTYLTEQGIRNASGNNFTNATINYMLKNQAYTGLLRSGETISEVYPHLQIVPTKQFERAQEIRKLRAEYKKEQDNSKENKVPMNTRSKSLLSGNLLYCGTCGARLVITTSAGHQKKFEPDSDTRRIRYVCYNRTRHKHLCDGQSGYSAPKIDHIVEEIICSYLDRAAAIPKTKLLHQMFSKESAQTQTALKAAKKVWSESVKLLEDYNGELIKVIRGESKFSSERLEALISDAERQVSQAREKVDELEQKMQNGTEAMQALMTKYNDVLHWSQIFRYSTMSAKKMVVSQLIHRVEVTRGYAIKIYWATSYQQFLTPEAATILPDSGRIETAVAEAI